MSDNPHHGKGRLFEGESRRGRWVYVWQTPLGLLLQSRSWTGIPQGDPIHWSTDQVNYRMEGEMLRLFGPDDTTLEIRDTELIDLLVNEEDEAPQRQPIGFLVPFMTIVAFTALGVVFMMVAANLLSERIARAIPMSLEARLGGMLHSGMMPSYCESPEQAEVLRRLVGRLRLNAPPSDAALATTPISVHLTDSGHLNAYALPGGEIVIEQSLIKLADDSDEVAAVLAHEVQHVTQRHVMARMLRGAGQATLLNAALGEYTGQLSIDPAAIRWLASLPFDRSAESSADINAVNMLTAAHMDGAALERFLAKIGSAEVSDKTGAADILASHPSDAQRLAALRAVNRQGVRPQRTALTPTEWQILHQGCHPITRPADGR